MCFSEARHSRFWPSVVPARFPPGIPRLRNSRQCGPGICDPRDIGPHEGNAGHFVRLFRDGRRGIHPLGQYQQHALRTYPGARRVADQRGTRLRCRYAQYPRRGDLQQLVAAGLCRRLPDQYGLFPVSLACRDRPDRGAEGCRGAGSLRHEGRQRRDLGHDKRGRIGRPRVTVNVRGGVQQP